MEQSTSVRVFRLIVLALIVFYFLTNFLPHVWINEVGWRWRYLTNWAQALSLIVAILMFARSFGFTTRWPDGLVSATVVMNIMVDRKSVV